MGWLGRPNLYDRGVRVRIELCYISGARGQSLAIDRAIDRVTLCHLGTFEDLLSFSTQPYTGCSVTSRTLIGFTLILVVPLSAGFC